MTQGDKITGQRVLKIFEELQQEKTLLKINLFGKDYNCLTCVTEVRPQKNPPCFLIDSAVKLPENLAGHVADRLGFEFIGKDNVKYVFTAGWAETSGKKIWLKLPEFIERQQRRQLYRLNAPPGTMLYFWLKAQRFELKVIDVSLGGARALWQSKKTDLSSDPAIDSGSVLENVTLVFAPRHQNLSVNIKQCRIKRIGKNARTLKYEYGLEFKELDREDKKHLNALILRFQREFLRKRLRIDI